ncbi:Protein CBG26991 [Caenorhabditis briggsae]|uniref:Protein CBG26991 n=1 Tax=Caenorhabditis briggsae TaxID=6238 RepID=B6IEV7_CAEBR|nr:Protein CBG26991 [Caenorhabditis briggsae]CAR98437.1 Protein CBG26991 [Caenorhabditis briggsae]
MNFTSYLDTPQFQALALHLMIGLEIPIHLFGVFCILFRTPDSMRSVKWGMLNLHVWSMGLDLGVSLLTIPYILYPALAGFTLGVLTDFDVPMAYQAYLLAVLIGLLGVSIVTILENRYFILFGREQWWRHCRMPFLIFNYIFALVYFYPAYYYFPDQASALKEVFRMLPELPQEIYDAPVFVLAIDFHYVVIPVFIMSNLLIAESGCFIILIYGNMNERTKKLSLSRHTIKMQRKFLRALNIQTAIPLLYLMLPMGYLVTSRIFNLYFQSANNLCFIIIGLHGLFSTIIMLYIHAPYREVCKKVFHCKLEDYSRRWSMVSTVL